MAVVILSWVYMMVICTLSGIGILQLLNVLLDFCHKDPVKIQFNAIHYLVAGIIGITVFVEAFSIFGKIGMCAHIIILCATVTTGILCRQYVVRLWKQCKSNLFSWEGFFYLGFIFLVAFFTSRGTFHTDTNIYHAQAIRIYEEYGLIKGMGNLQLHFAYNSAYLAFASAFSLNWLLGQSIHTTTGFIEVIMCIYAFHDLKNFRMHKSHITDMVRVGILFYTLVILNGSMSPATDYATMLFVLFVITEWCNNMETGRDVTIYSLLAVASVFVVTLKFSACLLVLIVVYPAIYLLKGRCWKEIGVYLGCGIVIIFPFLVRGFLISGWLLYPFNGIDLFNVEWKIPEEYLLVDADQIKVWGRCLYDVSKVDWPVFKWFSTWWEGQERYEQMLLGAAILGSTLLFIQFAVKLFKKEKMRWDFFTLMVIIFGCLVVWFFTAPFIRYGLAFLFAAALIPAGEYLSEEKRGFYSILTGGIIFCIVVSLSPYWDHYITDAGVFVKQNLAQPYYIWQKDYDSTETESYEINGNIIYYPVAGEINSYHVYPGTCYKFMLERSTLIGDDIKDGFRAKW